MSDLPIESTIYLMLSLHCVIGAIAAIIAQNKGRSLNLWLPLGLVVGTPALIVALLIKPKH
ncbi:MAG TPA: hypothetical protein DDW76_05685 [Cyanobacteria bacterium UBA11369]|nr:hypothetical protein [Cyanobacteria bacterium UBA11371]HBE33962.1 hypothetical protein [Cyanobacteria bacterium UBA11368]HBE48297.1 hypothetical protein [Cyanobacteria bacterium UBA11369]